MRIRLITLSLLLSLLAVACGSEDQTGDRSVPPATTAPATPAPDPTATTAPIPDDYGLIEDEDPYAENGARDPASVGESSSDRVPAPSPGEEPPLTGEVPEEIMAAIFSHAAASGMSREDLVVVRAEAVTWSDGSLGCPEPGVFYTQATVPGYWVVLDHDGAIHDYRVDDNGSFKTCDASGPPPTAPAG